jgi:hypothetical protein
VSPCSKDNPGLGQLGALVVGRNTIFLELRSLGKVKSVAMQAEWMWLFLAILHKRVKIHPHGVSTKSLHAILPHYKHRPNRKAGPSDRIRIIIAKFGSAARCHVMEEGALKIR